MEFIPEIWEEEPAPAYAADCRRCELSKHRARVVWGEGEPNASVLALLDNPGAREDKTGNAFVCATRVMLQRAVKDARLERSDVYVTYLLKCRPIRAYDKPAARDACSGWLSEQIELKKPRIAMLLGLTAAQTVLSLPDAQLSDLRERWHTAFGGVPALVTYHPLAVRRRPNLYRSFVSDWEHAAVRLQSMRESRLT
ncbi:uracil-DNA glycosylase [Paenibacillus alkalitolerans]|uniref:uracil-DNA glycosylase n=1 Tax=Paenibacillus alkalitolerans TaxID=2799335 RepID=UPI0018F3DA85|nr:uracil-DNA glycosylase [Paenibacillus alkalitolerans]